MRQYRGLKCGKCKCWVYGYFWINHYSNTHFIMQTSEKGLPDVINTPVIPKSVGQSTGLKDKNGKEIYEGDVIQTYDSKTLKIKVGCRIVQWNADHCWLESSYINEDSDEQFDKFYVKDFGVEIIGNKWEHPELLEKN